jgi:ribonuclease R
MTNNTRFRRRIEGSANPGKIAVGPKNLILLPTMSNRVTGTFRANARGFGFVIPLEPTHEGDLFIGPHETADAMDGDIVVAKIVRKGHQGGRQRIAGMITEILERGHNRFVGTLQRKGRVDRPAQVKGTLSRSSSMM